MQVFIPPELNDIESALLRFVGAMVFKLRKNVHKGRWEDLDISAALLRLREELGELEAAIGEGNYVEVLLESADVANFALILASIAIEEQNGEKKARNFRKKVEPARASAKSRHGRS